MVPYRLVTPTDFEILDACADGRRTVASNLAIELDQDRSYVNTRMRELAGQELLQNIGPADTSGLYQITPTGIAVLEHRDRYAEEPQAFTAAVEAFAKKLRIKPPSVDYDPTHTE
jgi:hypothetical protein